MTKLTTRQIRDCFVDFFKQNDHQHLESSSLIPNNDPSLLFVNAGMVQFKDIFTGQKKAPYPRIVTAQKALRVGGKHNDLDAVGRTARHHTFFEMLGNFSFGDYFKEQAIQYAWQFITKEIAIPKSKLCVTVYHEDDESYQLWQKIAGLPADKIIRIKTNDNFWSMGDLGPCGPCSEIFYDHGEKIFGGMPGSKDEDGDRFIEIWNLVFMQYEQVSKDERISLPAKAIDTGMGLERLAAVVQGVHNNYEIDLFQEIINQASSIIKVPVNGDTVTAYRVLADHLRAACFLIADGIIPGNEGRNYVLRRIIRRALRYVEQLGYKEPVMYKLVPKMVEMFGIFYPEIKRGQSFIENVLKQEEQGFRLTLTKGLSILNQHISDNKNSNIFSGEVAFKLYDTYGFPLDLTQDILLGKKMSVDKAEFDLNMQKQKEQARKSWSGAGTKEDQAIWFEIYQNYGETEFVGYNTNIQVAKVLAIIQNNQQIEQISEPGAEFMLLTNQTPFYAESGGQMGDVGVVNNGICHIEVLDTQKMVGKLHIHVCRIKSGIISNGDEVNMQINLQHRNALKAYHSATHLLHAVLRLVLGKHVMQKGSLVAADKLRFDFSHQSALSVAEIKLIEEKVNRIIIDNSKVVTEIMASDAAINAGAMALFGEKYDSNVRVVSMGAEEGEPQAFSFELCGGTHVNATGDIGLFKIISENAIASGVRRIEALCGIDALSYIHQQMSSLQEAADLLKSSTSELPAKIQVLQAQRKELEIALDNMEMQQLALSQEEITNLAVPLAKVKGHYIYKVFKNTNPKNLRKSIENLVKSKPNLLAIYVNLVSDNKNSIIIAAGSEVETEYSAKALANIFANIVDGKGGGSNFLAQIGGVESSVKIATLHSQLPTILAG